MTNAPDDNLRVVDNPDRNRFEAYVGEDLAGVMEYIPLPGRIIATHTETFRAFKGQGVSSRLVARALEELRSRGVLIQPLCPYVARFLRRHPDYGDIVDRSAPH